MNIYVRILIVFDLWDGNMGMSNQSQNLYLFRIVKDYETSTNVIGRLASTEFLIISIFF